MKNEKAAINFIVVLNPSSHLQQQQGGRDNFRRVEALGRVAERERGRKNMNVHLN